jgi:putative ABC transport system permease protein
MLWSGAASLAWQIVRHNPDRLVRSVLGIAFAILLMLVQLGFRNALLDSAIQILDLLNADVLVQHSDKDSFLERGVLPRDRLYQAQAVGGVERGFPLYEDAIIWKNPHDGTLRPIRLLGFSLDDPVFLSPEIQAQVDLLRVPGTALMDRASKSYYGRVGVGPAEAEGRSIQVVGTFEMGTDFELNGNLIVGEETFFGLARTLPDRSIQVVLLKVRDGFHPDTVAAALNRVLPWDAAAYSKEEMIRRERAYWSSATPVGMIFLAGTAVGFVAGIVILTQILFTLISDHLSEFATLKAIGYRDSFLVMVVLLMAFFLSVLGLVLSLVAGLGLYGLIGALTGLPMALTPARAGTVVILSLGLCALAGFMALRRVFTVDPAEVFR